MKDILPQGKCVCSTCLLRRGADCTGVPLMYTFPLKLLYVTRVHCVSRMESEARVLPCAAFPRQTRGHAWGIYAFDWISLPVL